MTYKGGVIIMQFIKNNWKKIISVILSLAIIAGIFTTLYYTVGVKPEEEIKVATVGNGKTLKVGIISDFQLPPKKPDAENKYANHLKKALELLKTLEVEMILVAGDTVDFASNYSYKTYLSVLDEVYPEEERPEMLYIMGNHDLWFPTDYKSLAPKQRYFKRYLKQSPFLHKVVNGYHFIAMSPDIAGGDSHYYSEEINKWLDEEIKKAQAETPDLPIFVMTHHNPQNTVYGSDIWYGDGINEVLSNYENVVSISGHSHYSILDERSIYQENYTAFTTQSLSNVDLETGKFDAFNDGGKITETPPNSDECPFLLVMNVSEKETTIERWNVLDQMEEKQGRRWTLSYPLTKDNFIYTTEKRLENAGTPYFDEQTTIDFVDAVPNHYKDSEPANLPGIAFRCAIDIDIVHSYKVILTSKETGEEKTYYYFTDFYLGTNRQSTDIQIALDPATKSGEYDVSVYAINSFDVESKPVTGTITYP